MARVEIPVDVVPMFGGAVALTGVVADPTNDHTVANGGNMLLVLTNASASSKTATVVSVRDEYGRLGDTTMTAGARATFDGVAVAGPFKPAHWNQGSGAYLFVDTAALATEAKLFALRIQP